MANPPENFLKEDKALACVHCGLCLGACPTYLETGNENESPRGRIYLMRAIQSGRLPLAEAAVRHIDLCLGCRACEVACPSGVQYGELLEGTREHIERHFKRPLFQRVLRRFFIEKIFPHARRMRLALWPGRWLKKLGLDKRLPKFARDALALIPADYSSGQLPECLPPSALPSAGRLGMIRGCVTSVLFADTNLATAQLLSTAGYEVITPRDQVCCGALYAHGGNLEGARHCARQNIDAFERLNLEAIIVNAAGCGSTLKEYGHLLSEDPRYADRARQFSAKVKDLTEWIHLQRARWPLQSLRDEARAPVAYHDACHLAHAQRITQPPREIVRALAGDRYVELPEAEVCCGSAGSYNLTEPDMAERLQRRKIENILRSGAKTIVTTNPGCILQIRAGLEKAGVRDAEVLHIADFLFRAIEAAQGKESGTSHHHG